MPAASKKPLMRLLDAIIAKANALTGLLALVGVLGLLALPMFERRVKFDEKSLMVGAAHPTVRSSSPGAVDQGLEMMNMVHDSYGAPGFVDKLADAMRHLGLEAYLSTFHPAAPSLAAHTHTADGVERSLFGGNGSWVRAGRSPWGPACTNLHAVLRSSRGDGKEAIVIVTPVELSQHVSEAEAGGRGSRGSRGSRDAAAAAGAAALLLGSGAMLSAHLGSVQWLSRDLVWVVPDAACGALGSLRQWVQQYQRPQQQGANQQYLGRAGVMQQAVVLEASSGQYDTLEVLLVGDNGQLPKLDMYHLLSTLGYLLQGTRVQLRGAGPQADWLRRRLAWNQSPPVYLSKLLTMAGVMAQQAAGEASGPHAAFKEMMVDAATASLSHSNEAGRPLCRPEVCALQLAEYLELAVRSLSNLSERFHHSFFLYLQTAADTFVPVEVYIIPVVAFLLGLVLQAASSNKQLQAAAGDHAAAGVEACKRQSTLADGHAAGVGGGTADQLAEEQQEEAVPTVTADPGPDCIKEEIGSGSGFGSHMEIFRSGSDLGQWLNSVLIVLAASATLTAIGLVALPWAMQWVPAAGSGTVGLLLLLLLPASRCVGGLISSSVHPLRLRVVALSLAAAALSALACMNWALAYCTAHVLLLIAWLAWHSNATWPSQDMQREGFESRVKAGVRHFVLAATSPVACLLVAHYVQSGFGSGRVSDVVWAGSMWQEVAELRSVFVLVRLACSGHVAVRLVFWGLYLPFWALAVMAGGAS